MTFYVLKMSTPSNFSLCQTKQVHQVVLSNFDTLVCLQGFSPLFFLMQRSTVLIMSNKQLRSHQRGFSCSQKQRTRTKNCTDYFLPTVERTEFFFLQECRPKAWPQIKSQIFLINFVHYCIYFVLKQIKEVELPQRKQQTTSKKSETQCLLNLWHLKA